LCAFTFRTQGCGRVERPAFPAPSSRKRLAFVAISRDVVLPNSGVSCIARTKRCDLSDPPCNCRRQHLRHVLERIRQCGIQPQRVEGGILHGADSQGREARRFARHTADQIRTGNKPQDRQGARAKRLAFATRPRRRSD